MARIRDDLVVIPSERVEESEKQENKHTKQRYHGKKHLRDTADSGCRSCCRGSALRVRFIRAVVRGTGLRMVMCNSKNEKNMKKIILSIMAVSALFACQKETVPVDDSAAEKVSFTAYVDGADTKTVLDENTLISMWLGKEYVALLTEDMGKQTLISDVDSPSASTTLVVENPDYQRNGKVMAVYPNAYYENYNVGDEMVPVTIPSEQKASLNTYDPNAVFATAVAEGNSLRFKNAVALLKFELKSEVWNVIIHGVDEEAVTGAYVLDHNNGNPTLTPAAEGTKTYVKLVPAEGSSVISPGVYYLAVAPQTFSNGIVAQLSDTKVRESSKKCTFGRNKIINLGVLELPEVDKWGLSGSHNEWGFDQMTLNGDWYTIAGVSLYKSSALKFRGEEGWTTSRTYDAGAAESGVEYELKSGSGNVGNITIKERGVYTVYLYKDATKFKIVKTGDVAKPAAQKWLLSGDMNSWGKTLEMTDNGDWYVAEDVTILKNQGFKFRVDTESKEWADSRGGATSVESGKVYTVYGDGGNMSVKEDAIYDVYLSCYEDEMKVIKVGDYVEPDVTVQTLYLNTGGSSLWNQAGARFAAYFWADGVDAVWTDMISVSADVYKCSVPTNCNKVIFCRMNPDFNDNGWDVWEGDQVKEDHVWNQTADLTISSFDFYTITGWDAGSWSYYSAN